MTDFNGAICLFLLVAAGVGLVWLGLRSREREEQDGQSL